MADRTPVTWKEERGVTIEVNIINIKLSRYRPETQSDSQLWQDGSPVARYISRLCPSMAAVQRLKQAIYKHATVSCKCHGVSGSCSLKTCWQSLPDFRSVGNRLKEKYNGATKVHFNSRGTRLVRRNHKFNKPTKEDIIYLDDSPDYCTTNPAAGVLGTVGRECDWTSKGLGGCALMCCGRGYNSFRKKVTERCHCKFEWCCEVICDTCEYYVDVHVCK
uniref:Protein Wnt n=1 Tax=Octopus bimaculoides TaxID=37653 RepID=A0A0L8I5R6_OCTBM